MRVLVAGATGAIGRQLVPMLVDSGHEVIGLTRSEEKFGTLRAAGAEPAVADALDAESMSTAVRSAGAEVVVHQLTAIPAAIDNRRFGEEFEQTNRLRREGTRNLVEAAVEGLARRVVVQSLSQAYAPVGGWVRSEEDPLYADAPPPFREIFGAIIDLEATALGAEGIETVVLRYGNFYGPGTAFGAESSNAELVRRRQYPIAGGGTAHWSFIHIADAARATVAAIEDGETGTYNVVDDEPAAVAEWLPVYAAALGAPPPPRIPPPSSGFGIFGMLEARGASNAKARERWNWAPEFASWRQGFPADLGAGAVRG
jgi:nucleoside-diphosphate-sugar epimerase